MASPIDIAKSVAVIAAAYPSFNASKETVEVYCKLLQDLPVEELNVAVLKVCAENGRKFAPSIGEIRGAVAELRQRAQGVPSAVEAWEEVIHAPKSGGWKRATDEKNENGDTIIEFTPYVWTHPLVERIVTQLGWPRFPDWNNESFERAHFFKQYEAALPRYASEASELPVVAEYVSRQRLSAPQPISNLLKGRN